MCRCLILKIKQTPAFENNKMQMLKKLYLVTNFAL